MSDLFRSGIPYDFAFFEGFDLRELLRATAWRTSALKADSSNSSPSWMSIARRVFPSRLELKRRAGSFRDAPLAKVNFTMDLYVSPVQMIPSCDHVGVPGFVGFTHFNSSTTSGSASLMSSRILLRVSPRQSPSSAILFEISSDADWPWLALGFFMFSSWKFLIAFGFRLVSLAETVAGVRHGETAIRLCRHLEIISSSVVLRRRGSLLAWRRRRDWRHGQ